MLYLLIGLTLFDDYGISWDELISRYNGVVTIKYLVSLVAPGMANSPAMQAIPDLHTWIDRDYGVVFEVPLVLMEKVLGIEDNHSPALYRMRHLFNFLIFFVGVIFFYRLVLHRFKHWLLAVTGALFLILSPRIFAESFYNNKDIVFLSFFIIATYFLVRFLDAKTGRNAFWLALASALAINIRILGVILPAVTLGFVFWDMVTAAKPVEEEKKMAPAVLVFVGFFIAFTILFWPYLWENPAGNFIQAFSNMSRFRWKYTVLYLGEFVYATQVPWHYIPVWIGITTPVLYLILFGLGVAFMLARMARSGWRLYRSPEDRQDVLFLALFFGPLLAVILMNSVLYDGWRQMYFIYGAFLMISLRGLYGLWAWGKSMITPARLNGWQYSLAAVVLLSLGAALVAIIRNHPHQNVYFNPLAGDKVDQTFERDYWGISYRQALEYIVKHDKRNTIRVKANTGTGITNEYMLSKPDQQRLQFVQKDFDYYVTEYRWSLGNDPYGQRPDKQYLQQVLGPEVFTIEVDDFRIIGVYKARQSDAAALRK